MRKIIYTVPELREYKKRRLLGTVEIPLEKLIFNLHKTSDNHPLIVNVFNEYGRDVVFGPILTTNGREKKGTEHYSGIYRLS